MKLILEREQPVRLYSYADLAKAVDRDRTTIWGHIDRGNVPRATIKHGKRWYYSQAEFDVIVSFMLDSQRV